MFKYIILPILLLFIFSSCYKDINLCFTDEEREFLIYNYGDIIKLIKEPQTDTLNFVFAEINQDTIRQSSLGLQYRNHEWYQARLNQNDISNINITASKEEFFEIDITLIINGKTEF